jgi:predicted nucleic acid-binding protein
MRIALDTNIMAYAEGLGDKPRCEAAIRIIEQLPAELVVIPAQTLGELFRVLTKKANRDATTARQAIMTWADSFEIADSSWVAFQAAMDLATDHRLQLWDSLIMAVAAERHCRMILSEDLQNGFIWRGLTVVNPFSAPLHPLLKNILA